MSIKIQEITQVVEIDETHVQIITVGIQGPPGSGSGGGGATNHGALTGLGDDDHPQYHNDARGDARYYTKTQSDVALAGKATATHSHVIGDVTGLQAALDSKAVSAHGHTIADVSGLQAVLDSKADNAALVQKADINFSIAMAVAL